MTLFPKPQPFDGNAFGTTKIEQQRDELLAALKEAREFIGDACPAHGECILPLIDAVIAKVEAATHVE